MPGVIGNKPLAGIGVGGPDGDRNHARRAGSAPPPAETRSSCGSSAEAYESVFRTHLEPAFGSMRLDAIGD